jgi:MtN3 and saliva related transmembrane protein
MNPDYIGWVATTILILTIGRQSYTQWRDKSTAGVSSWLFIGQLAASAGFVAYSVMLGNIVFIVSNCFLLVIAGVGQWMYKRNERNEAKA